MVNYYNNKYNGNPKDGTPKFLDSSVPKFSGKLKPLMTEEQKSADRVPIDELAFDFSCRVTRMYKWLNEGKLSKADRDIVGAYGLQMLRSASSVSANLKAAIERVQCPNSFERSFSRAKLLVKASPAMGCRAAEREQARRSQ